MPDNSTGLIVKSLTNEFVRAKIVDTGGTNEVSVSAGGRLSVDGSSVTQPVSGSLTLSAVTPGTGATNLGKAEDAVAGDGDVGIAMLAVRRDAASSGVTADGDYANLSVDSSGALRVTGGSGGVQYVGDAAATATPTGTVSLGLANAAAPTDVSANNDAVAQWMLRNGSTVTNLASGGALITVGQKAMAASLPVVIASDQSAFTVTANAGTGPWPVTDNGASLTVDAPVATPVYVRLSDGAANLVGQKTSANSLPVVIASDQSAVTVAGTVTANAGTGTFANNLTQINGNAVVTAGLNGTLAIGGTTAHDGVGTAILPALIGGYANAAAPADVTTDLDAVRAWFLRNGSQVVNVASGGTLWTNMGQTAATGQFARVTDGTTTAGVIVGSTALKTDLSSIAGTVPGATAFVPARLTDGVAYYTRMGQTQATAPYEIISDGTTFATVRDLAANDALNVAIVDGAGAQITTFGGGTQYTGDNAVTATPTGTMSIGLANAAAPTDVSANNDAVAQWFLRNGSAVVNVASGGTLITLGSKTSAGSFPVVIASDQGAIAVTPAANSSVNITQIGGSSPNATAAYLPTRLTDGTAYYTNTGQTIGTSAFSRVTDGTTTAGVIVGTTALKTDFSSIVGAVPAATNPVPVRLTDGSAFYTSGSGAPTLPIFSTQTSSALGAGASATLTHYVTSGKTGQLMGVDVTSTVAMKVVINTVVTGTPTTRVVLFTLAGVPIIWRSPYKTFITRASADASSGFSVTITNKDASVAADIYSTSYWDEV